MHYVLTYIGVRGRGRVRLINMAAPSAIKQLVRPVVQERAVQWTHEID